MLPFNRGEIITVLVQQPRNGWLYGRADSSSRSSLRSSSSMSDLLSQPESSSHSRAPPPAPPLSSYQQFEMPPITTPEKRTKSKSEHKSSKPHASQPELFPRGTNPFATVKLKPTSTDDRSTPRVGRR
ncbi:Brain-specific angiogenesis inhibitor 1-associated protein 2-like protein 2 [Liparis tanakae]|uniref:Brain-specific angiogenesis inhibitor 1-associated protein 2-like protein 2 n=1 Tax=Liparis tanakae TaxID=230148 RepID=A0A4Z2G000_9TELE|nr:Brain-specific angiogenesis inhibitor 1-associated protein 2-like protein 2 [Liparis tanakae]